ncbi:MAG TPA: anti-sigma factor [Terriglobales bacterium]|nr:anti-sigma factor [Terriglobales bacterium]
MVIDCKHVWREISNYIENDLDPELRREIELHLETCRHCAALLDSTHNVLVLIADQRTFRLPAGFHERLMKRLAEEIGAG